MSDSRMRGWVDWRALSWSGLTVIGLIVGYLAYPYLTLFSTLMNVSQSDCSTMADYVAWDRIREQVRQQLLSHGLEVNESIMTRAPTDNFRAANESFYGQDFSPKLIAITAAWRADLIATPQGFCRVIVDEVRTSSPSTRSRPTHSASILSLVSQVPFAGFAGFDTFHVEMGEKGSYAFRVNSFIEGILYQFQLSANCTVATIRTGYVL
jgi:hypothetical protein